MYKVLIADDESSVRESLLLSISWNEFDMEVVGCASTGKEALEIASREKIDIAILDIRMPGINGLEVCANLRKMKENIQLIIISGYAEFSYAERAMEFGVLGYCLKPLDYDKVKKLLVKAAGILERERNVGKILNFADAIEQSDEATLRELLVRAQLNPEQFYLCVSIGDAPCTLDGKGISVLMGRKFFAYFTEKQISKTRMQQGIENKILGIGYEKNPISVHKLKEELQSCKIRAYQFFVKDGPCICAEENPERSSEILTQITEKLNQKDWTGLYEKLYELRMSQNRDYDITFCMKLNNRIYSSKVFSDVEADYYMYDFSQLVSEYHQYSNMLEHLEQTVMNIGESKSAKEYSNSSFMKLLSWIQKNYKNEISLTQAAEQMHMNPNYVSRMFKKEAGTTFVHYVTQLRMEEAARLLTTTNQPVVDIAIAVGFNDYFYFLKLFKKYSNKTPSQYREA